MVVLMLFFWVVPLTLFGIIVTTGLFAHLRDCKAKRRELLRWQRMHDDAWAAIRGAGGVYR